MEDFDRNVRFLNAFGKNSKLSEMVKHASFHLRNECEWYGK